jgi:tetratricopeptide (TPR) repeat protein
MMTLVTYVLALGLLVSVAAGHAYAGAGQVSASIAPSSLARTNLYLAAGDYRRALEACQREIDDAPSAAGYIRLTYVYQAIDAYLDHLSQEERWMQVEQMYLNLAYRDTGDLVDPPGGLARMAKEMIQTSVRQQADVSSAMAARLDKAESDRLWVEQAQWRTANPKTWWQGIPATWGR